MGPVWLAGPLLLRDCAEFFGFERKKILNRNVDKFCCDLLISSAALRTRVKLLRDQNRLKDIKLESIRWYTGQNNNNNRRSVCLSVCCFIALPASSVGPSFPGAPK